MGKRSKKRLVQKKLERAERRLALKKEKRNLAPPSFQDNFGKIITPIELVFPIIRFSEDKTFEAVGTGFFVHPAGGFVTARHCLYNRGAYDNNCFAIHTIEGQQFIRKIQYFEAHPTADIGIGMLKGVVKDRYSGEISLRASFPISLTPPNINDEISTLAYPRMKINNNKVGNFPCDKYTGKVLEYLPHGTGWLKSECFITNMEIRSGASGGPVLRNNHIVGVNSSAMDLSGLEEPISFITPIQQIIELPIKDGIGQITTVKELMKSGHMPWAE